MKEHILIVDEMSHSLRLDVFLAQYLENVSSRTYVKKIIDLEWVTLNKKKVKAHHKVFAGDEVIVRFPEEEKTLSQIEPEPIPLDIFYEDERLLIVNKPAGMLVHPVHGCRSGTLVNALLHHCKKLSDVNSYIDESGNEKSALFRPGIVHRLDRETSGLLIVAKDNQAHVRIARQFEKHKVKKRYIALVKGIIEFDEGMIDAPLGQHHRSFDKRAVSFREGAKAAKTFYKVLKRSHHPMTLVALYPQSGRTHQLRVHMAYLGHPIRGDKKYGIPDTFFRLALHAQSLAFFHPESKHNIEFSTTIPKEFQEPFAA